MLQKYPTAIGQGLMMLWITWFNIISGSNRDRRQDLSVSQLTLESEAKLSLLLVHFSKRGLYNPTKVSKLFQCPGLTSLEAVPLQVDWRLQWCWGITTLQLHWHIVLHRSTGKFFVLHDLSSEKEDKTPLFSLSLFLVKVMRWQYNLYLPVMLDKVTT